MTFPLHLNVRLINSANSVSEYLDNKKIMNVKIMWQEMVEAQVI
jgi:hypothetical protein